jgi:hypothetical protein
VTRTAAASGAGGTAVAPVAPAESQGGGASGPSLGLPDIPEPNGPLGVGAVLGDVPNSELGLALLAGGMILLALTALALLGMLGRGGATRRFGFESARPVRALRERGEALPALVLAVATLAVWSAIALWAMMS